MSKHTLPELKQGQKFSMALKLKPLFFLFALLSTGGLSAQYKFISGDSGKLRDTVYHSPVNYKVNIQGPGSMRAFEAEDKCGFIYPYMDSPWTGNSSDTVYITYTFSKPVYSIDVVIAYCGINGMNCRENFEFRLPGTTPGFKFNSGQCAKWSVKGNRIYSPDTIDAQICIVTVYSDKPFTSMTIVSGNNSQNGGSTTGLVENSVRTDEPSSTPFMVKPDEEEVNPKKNKTGGKH